MHKNEREENIYYLIMILENFFDLKYKIKSKKKKTIDVHTYLNIKLKFLYIYTAKR